MKGLEAGGEPAIAGFTSGKELNERFRELVKKSIQTSGD